MLYQAAVKELEVLPNVGLVVSLYFVQDCRAAIQAPIAYLPPPHHTHLQLSYKFSELLFGGCKYFTII